MKFNELLPPPLGEGRDRGSQAPAPAFDQMLHPTTASPHPNPLPGGEGTKKMFPLRPLR